MKNKLLTIFLLITSLSVFSQINYYVDGQNGNNSNNGLTSGNAFKTIQFAVNSATHGDTILVMSGIYSNLTFGTIDIWKEERTVDIANKMSANNLYLTIKPLIAGTVTIKGDGFYIFQIRNSSYIKIEGFNIVGEAQNIPLSLAFQYQFTYKDAGGTILERVPTGSTPAQISALTLPVLNNIKRPTYFNTSAISVNGSHHIDITNNNVNYMPGEGIRSFTSDFLNIIGNKVSGCSSKSSFGVHGLSVYNMNSNIDATNSTFTDVRILIAKNEVYNNVNEVYSWSEQKTFITPQIDEGKGITVQRCTNAYLWLNGKIRLENNISYNNGFSGIHINSGDRIEIINNTCYGNNQTTLVTNLGDQHGISLQDAHTALVANNIVQASATTGGFVIKVGSTSNNIVINSNILFGNIHPSAIPYSTNTQNVNPNFVNPSLFDFSLQNNSMAINNANSSYAPATDFFGNTRNTPDIGAIEYLAPLSINNFTAQNESLIIYPNPTNDGIINLKNNSENEKISIYSINGKLITDIELKLGETKIDLSNLPNSIYLIKKGNKIAKIIKNSH
jgi:parallel beta-helix repeat protein